MNQKYLGNILLMWHCPPADIWSHYMAFCWMYLHKLHNITHTCTTHRRNEKEPACFNLLHKHMVKIKEYTIEVQMKIASSIIIIVVKSVVHTYISDQTVPQQNNDRLFIWYCANIFVIVIYITAACGEHHVITWQLFILTAFIHAYSYCVTRPQRPTG